MGFSSEPSWIVPGAFIDLDFINRRYWNAFVSESSGQDKNSICTNSGAYGGVPVPYTPLRNGMLIKGLSNQIRITDLGMFIEGPATNKCLWSRDMTNSAWDTKTTVTVALDQASPVINETGSNCSSVLATGADSIITQSITLSSQIVIYSAYVKRLVGTGEIDMTMDGGSTWTPITSQINSSTFSWVQIAQQTLANPVVGFRIRTSGDSIAVDFNQAEVANGIALTATNKATTPIVTTTASKSRGNDQNQYQKLPVTGSNPDNGQRIINDLFSYLGPWSLIASFNGDLINGASVKGPGFVVSDFADNPISFTCGAGLVGFGNDQANKTANFCNIGRGNWNIGAVRCTFAGRVSCLNGQAPSSINTGSSQKPGPNLPFIPGENTHFGLFNNGAGTSGMPLNGSIARACWLKRDLTDGELQLYTDPLGPFRTY